LNSHSCLRRSFLCAVLATAAAGAQAQANVMKVVVPFPAGGVTDQVARVLTEHMARRWARRSSSRTGPVRAAGSAWMPW